MTEHIVIERTDAEQQFHVRFVSGNGQRTFWCENLKTKASAKKAIISHARTFVQEGAVEITKDSMVSALALVTRSASGYTLAEVEIRQVDSRTKR